MRNVDNEAVLLANGFDAALIGNCARTFKAIYRLSTMIDILITDEGMDYDEAREYLDFNVIGAYVGEHTPIYLNDIDVV
tara:strand:+ start:771 stop:1007 length:237 start_codon:yes stop_codon:yes gene_type:complete